MGMQMKDVQNLPDERNIPIDKVGVKNLRYPITVLDRSAGRQHTVARVNMYVDLPARLKGAHMSRFVELLHTFRPGISIANISRILEEMKDHLAAKRAHIDLRFPYFIKKNAPTSGAESLMDYDCRIIGESGCDTGLDLVLEVRVPVTSVCPCSKEISDAGAHNQRGEVRLSVRFRRFVWIEDMISLVESQASCDVFSLLKRADEKYVTERGYANAKFVEDVVRDIAAELEADENIYWYSVSAENFESIHNHNAYACITGGGKNRIKP